MIANQTFTNQCESVKEPIKIQRRTLIGGALATLLASSVLVMADEEHSPSDPFIVLLQGIYQPVSMSNAPTDNLGLTAVNLGDGSYSRTKIYPVWGVDGAHDQKKAIGTFYVQFAGNLCAYDLPGGAIAMQFTAGGFTPHPDGTGGLYLEATFELTILEATGIYQPFQGGHNHMVDRLHQLANGSFDEFCFCNISQYQFP